jgi:hypothetical protein
MLASQRPAMVIVSDPGDQAVGRDYSFQEEEQTMHTAKGEDCGGRSEEDGKEDENNLFEEGDDLEGARVSPIREDVIPHIDDPRSPDNRYSEMRRLWTFELLRTCGNKATDMARDQFLVPSRQALSQMSPYNYFWLDLTDFSLMVEWVRTWRNNMPGKIGHNDCLQCILVCDALPWKPSVEETTRSLKDISVSDSGFDCDLFDSLLASRKGFFDFVKTCWYQVLHAAFVFQVQPLGPDLRPFIALAQPAADRKARKQHAQLLQDLKVIRESERITTGASHAFPSPIGATLDIAAHELSTHRGSMRESLLEDKSLFKWSCVPIAEIIH